MGRIVMPRKEFTASISELVGHKAGLALSETQMVEHAPDYTEYLDPAGGEGVAIRSEEVHDLIAQLLYGVGNTPLREPVSAGLDTVRHLSHIPNVEEIFGKFAKIFQEVIGSQSNASGPYDMTPVLIRSRKELGVNGELFARTYIQYLDIQIQQDPWSSVRRTRWRDILELDELFKSESLDVTHGSYIDQRFIDYLERNFAAIDSINWRKFEALTSEFFERLGYSVKISEGRNDGNVDIRVWPTEATRRGNQPPAILVQCKREKTKVGKVVVKALWADVKEEGANGGLIVTTNALSPGARKVVSARAYPLHEANRETVRAWINAMRTPQTGVFLGL